jgi:hypothetical protein
MSDWGKGVINNIGWGQGANNDIGWGSIYDKSNAGETLLSNGGFEGLLNKFPGASLGLSLDKLDKNYTGSAIKVRRSSDNNELDIGFVNNELDTASLLTFAGSGDAFVTIWYDSSGLNDNAFQTSAGNQPKIVDSGSVILDEGKPAFLFSGNQWLQTVNTYPTSQYLSAFYLASSTEDNQRVIDTRGTGGLGGVKGWQAKFSNSLTGDITAVDNGANKYHSTQNITRSGKKLVSLLINGGSVGVNSYIKEFTNSALTQEVNSSEIIDYDSGNVLTIGANSNGQNTQRFSGKLQSIILYSADKGSERVGIENNINTYYNIY